MQTLGQHFLKNKSAVELIVRALELAPGDTVVEIGAGHGELTLQMANSAGQITAIEKDGQLVQNLESRIQNPEIKNVRIVHGDALKILPDVITELPNYRITNYKLVGNIPYYITGHLLRIISELEQKPERCVFTVQREVAERIVAVPPKANRLSISVGYWAAAKIVKTLHPGDFSPAPKVDSAIIAFEKKLSPAFPDADQYYAAARAIFAQPRKTVLNNLTQRHAIWDKGQGNGDKKDTARILKTVGIDPEARPQNMSMENIAAIARAFF